MTTYNSLSKKNSNSQHNKFKSAIKNLLLILIEETNFPRKLSLTDRQDCWICNFFLFFFAMLLGTLDASFLGNILTGKAAKAKIPRQEITRAVERTIREG